MNRGGTTLHLSELHCYIAHIECEEQQEVSKEVYLAATAADWPQAQAQQEEMH